MHRFLLTTRPLRCAVALLLLAGCAATPVPDLAPTDVPTGWQGPLDPAATVWPERSWWNSFGDAELSALIDEVRANNLDLANNRRNLRAAQLTLREAGFNLLPTPVLSISTGANYSVTRNNGVTIDSGPNTPTRGTFSLSYNDILSKPLNYERSTADYEARVAQLIDLSLNTLGTASSTYFQLLLTRDKIEAAQQNVTNAEAIGAIAQSRVNAGVAVPIEALQQQIAIQRERANLSSLRQSELSARSSLALLLGRGVQDFDVTGRTLTTLAVPTIQPGLPAELLRRRPSLVQAEANLRSATANVDLARLKFLPQISLTGSAGASSTRLVDFVSSPTLLADISASLAQTLLDNGQRLRNVEQTRIQLENSLSSYRKAVLAAFNEIEVLLRNIQLLEQLGRVAAENLTAAEESFRIAQARYREGVIDYQSVLTSQNTLFSTRNAMLDNKLQRLNAMISFYQALGGGWQTGAEPDL